MARRRQSVPEFKQLKVALKKKKRQLEKQIPAAPAGKKLSKAAKQVHKKKSDLIKMLRTAYNALGNIEPF